MGIDVQAVTSDALTRMLDSKTFKKMISASIDDALVKERFNLEDAVAETIRKAVEDGKVL